MHANFFSVGHGLKLARLCGKNRGTTNHDADLPLKPHADGCRAVKTNPLEWSQCISPCGATLVICSVHTIVGCVAVQVKWSVVTGTFSMYFLSSVSLCVCLLSAQ